MTYRTALNLITAVAFAAGIVIPAVTFDAPVGGWVGYDYADRTDTEVNTPTFTTQDAADYPACTATTSGLTDKLVVHLDAGRSVMTFGEVSAMPKSAAGTYWVIGSCGA